MAIKSISEREKDPFKQWQKFQLPNYFKKIGIGAAAFFFIALFVNAFTLNNIVLREFIKYGLLVGLLIISISKEPIEDELIMTLRMQSFTFAFIAGVGLTLVQPFLNYGVDLILSNSDAVFTDMGDFQILWILLSVQVLYFGKLKRIY